MSESDEPSVVLVAAACAPFGGSEGKVGWEGVLAISSFAEVHVLTAAHYRSEWEKARQEGDVPEGVNVEFLGSEKPWHSNRLVARAQSWFRYLTFMRELRRELPKLLQQSQPDLIHHLTYATWRVPAEVWQYGLPSIWGPIGGSGAVPHSFRLRLSRMARILELLRGWHGKKVSKSQKFRDAMGKTSMVLVANQETRELLKSFRGRKAMKVLPVAYLSEERIRELQRIPEAPSGVPTDRCPKPLILFAGGNIEGRKGVGCALQALAKVKAAGIPFHYTVAGGGPDIENLKELSLRLGIREEVTFHSGFRGDAYLEELQRTDIFLMPSFRETLGMTCQEAILAGCYPLVADISAQGEMSRAAGIIGVSVESEEALVNGLAERMIAFAKDPARFKEEASRGSEKLATFFSKNRYIETMRGVYDSLVNQPR